MKKITVINQKGGVGKTTTAISIFAGLKKAGHKCLFIDLDGSGNATFSLGASIVSKNELSAMDVLRDGTCIKDSIKKVGQGDVIPSSKALDLADSEFQDWGREYLLRGALEEIEDMYDFCIIDTPPVLGIKTINALSAADGVIIPAQADAFSLQGIGDLANTLRSVRKHANANLKIMGIVLTRFNGRATISKEIEQVATVQAQNIGTKVYNSRIRECTALKESQLTKVSIFDYDAKSNAAADYKNLVDEILMEV